MTQTNWLHFTDFHEGISGSKRLWPNVKREFFDDLGRVTDYGIADAELADLIDAGIAFRTSGCPGKFQDDISACDRPYGDSPPSDIASYPFQPKKKDIKRIRKQLDIPVTVE